jgi:murein DD-endopeptidase MepM/ murein hydrolase activator NlpD/muramidase (phage lysozyme)
MANPSVLTPIGFDTPPLQYAVTPQVAQALQPDTTPDTTGLNVLNEANKSFQQTNQVQIQGAQMRAQALDSINKMQVASAQAIGQAEQVNFQATAASGASNVRAWASLAENIGGVVDKVTKAAEAKRLAELKADLDRNQLLSTTELENLQVEWIEKGRIGKEGTTAYRRAVGEVLASRPLQADTISALTTKYYAPALDHAKQQNKLVFDEAQKIAENNRSIESKRVQFDLIAATAALKQEAFLPPGANDEAIQTIKEKIDAIYKRTDIDDITKSQVVLEALEPVLRAKILGADSTAELGRLQAGHAAVANYITANAPRVMDGTLPQSTFNEESNQIRRAYGLPSQDATPPDVDLQRTVKNLETNQTLEDLNKKGIINQLEKMEGNELYAQSVGLQLFLNPTSLSLMKNTKPELLDRNAKAGIELAERATKFFGETTTRYQKEYAAANEAILKIQQQDYRTAISLINKSGEDNTQNSLAASLRGLGLGMPTPPPGQVGVTQEQLDFMAANSTAVQQAIRDSLKPTTDAYNNEAKTLAQMGFHGDKGKSQAHLKILEGKTKEYNERLEALRLNRITQLTPQQPGQSPNFNGGSLGAQAPLMKRGFRGIANVTMPFPVDAAKAMADAGGAGSGGFFGDYRSPTRSHDGVDFPVPVGTPVLSLVYGTVTEVQKDPRTGASYGNALAIKGDDGREYFYAHLDSSRVKVGQRVGPGEKVGYSGDTGAPGGPHLHMEISVGGKVIDPLQVLSTGNFGSTPPQIRTSGPTSRLPAGQVKVDPRAIPIGGGSFLIDGQIVKFAPDYSESKAFKQNMVDIKGLQNYNVNTRVHDIKVAPGLTPIGYTSTADVTTETKPGSPVGYYTFRDNAGNVLTQTAYHKKGATTFGTSIGFDGKGYQHPERNPVAPIDPPSKVDPSKAGRVLMQRTGIKDEAGLEVIAVTMFDKSGRSVGTYNVNAGSPEMQGSFGGGGTTVAGSNAPLEYGSYTIGQAEAAYDVPGMRSDFVPITPTFKTQRSLLGIHFDGDRSTKPGSAGCIVFKNKAEFDAFKNAIAGSSISRLDFEAGLTGVKVVSPPQASQETRTGGGVIRANKEGQRLASYLSNPNVNAFLDAIANAEGLEGRPGGGYDLGFGYRKISSLAEHPYVGRELTPEGVSSASGRFQFMGHTWGDMKRALGLQDFSPVSQQVAALKQLEQAGVLEKVASGRVDSNVLSNIAGIWASIEKSAGGGQSAYSNNNVTPGGSHEGFLRFFNQRRKQTPTPAPATAPQVPNDGRVPIGGGKFMLRGKIISKSFTPSRPLEQSFASPSVHDYAPVEQTDSLGYEQLVREPETLASIHSIAKDVSLPPQWIADVAALHGTNGIDGPEELAWIHDKIKAGKLIKTPTDLVAVVLGDASKVTDLGVHTGRRYDSQFSRFERATALTHTRVYKDCRLCYRLQAHSQFVPHKAEVA